LRRGEARHLAQQQAQIFPVQKLGLLDIQRAQPDAGQPLLKQRLSRIHDPGHPRQQRAKKQ
jgi:hypothetical protein